MGKKIEAESVAKHAAYGQHFPPREPLVALLCASIYTGTITPFGFLVRRTTAQSRGADDHNPQRMKGLQRSGEGSAEAWNRTIVLVGAAPSSQWVR